MATELSEAYRPASRYKVGDEIRIPGQDWRRITAIRQDRHQGRRYIVFDLSGSGDPEAWFSPSQSQWHRRTSEGGA